MSHFRIIFVIATLIICMIATVHIRSVNNRNFYHLRELMVTQARLKQSLYHKRIKLEYLTNSQIVLNRITQKEQK